MLKVKRKEIPALIPHIGLLINIENDRNRKRQLMKVMMSLLEAVRRAEDYDLDIEEIALIKDALESFYQLDLKTLLKLR